MRTSLVFAFSLLAFITPAYAGLGLHFDVQPDSILPGVPASMRLTVTNTSDSAAILQDSILLEVSRDNGPFWTALYGMGQTHGSFLPYSGEDLIISANSTKDFYLSIDKTMTMPQWFFDRRLSLPGIYRLRMKIQYRLPTMEDSATATSPEDMLIIEEPKGVDAVVWHRMRELNRKDGWGGEDWINYGFAISKEIWEKHPESAYLQYVCHMIPISRMKKLEACDQAIRKFPSSPSMDLMRLTMAGIYDGEIQEALRKQNTAQAKNLLDKREQHVQWLKTNSKNPFTLEEIMRFPSWEAHVAIEQNRRKPANSKTPRLDKKHR